MMFFVSLVAKVNFLCKETKKYMNQNQIKKQKQNKKTSTLSQVCEL